MSENKNAKRLVLFDLDGTLIDPYEAITKGAQYALADVGIHISNRDELIPFIGPPLWDSMRAITKSTDEAFIAKVVSKYREYFAEHGVYENKLYPGVVDMLERLKGAGLTLTIATSKLMTSAIEIVKYLGIEHYFDLIIGCEPDGTRSNKDDVIRHVLANVNLDGQEPVMIGDRKFDIIGAKKTGITSIGITWGYGPREELEEAGADFIVDSMDELCEEILKEGTK